MPFIKLYKLKPKIGDYVNFIFTEHNDDYLQCYLIDYDLQAIMVYKCLTNKKKIKSVKSLAPLNKNMIGIIENIDNDNIELNLINVNKNEEPYLKFVEENSINSAFKKLINKYIHTQNENLQDVLNNYIHIIDLEEDDNYLNYILNTETNNKFYDYIKSNYENKCVKQNEVLITIKCYGDINQVINLFDKCIEISNLNDINIIQPKVSQYSISSSNNLDDFICIIKDNIKEYNDLTLIN